MKNIKELNLDEKKYIIFDLDGTLIDSIGLWNQVDQNLINRYSNLKLTADHVQKDRDDFLNNNQGGDIYQKYCNYLVHKYSLAIDGESLLGQRWTYANKLLENIDFKEGATELLYMLKNKGFKVILATLTSKPQLDVYAYKNKNMRNKLKIYEFFDLIVGKEDVKFKKPNPEIYEKIVSHFYASIDECLVFEDSYTGVLAAKKAGIDIVNIYDKYSDMDREKIDRLIDYKISNYGEIINHIGSKTKKRLIR